MKILVVEHFAGNLDGTDNDRFVYLSKLLAQDSNNQVELVTSSFSHERKQQKEIKAELYPFKITLIKEDGYPTNVCIKRFKSHYDFGKNLESYLNNMVEKPDLVYCGMPSLSCVNVAANYCKKNNIRFIIDIQDLWPEAFKMVFHIPVLSNIIFAPFSYYANRAYKSADEIVAVSETYLNRALKVNKKAKNGIVAYLGTDKDEFDKNASNVSLVQNNKIKLVYIGTLGASYDISNVISAIKVVQNKIPQGIEFIIIGDGPCRKNFEKHAIEEGIDYVFTGRLPYPQMVEELYKCDIAINPIKRGSAGSIINKVCDYAMAGLPVINTQECQEYRNLLDKYNAGINCQCENVDDISESIRKLSCDHELRELMAKNSRVLGETVFSRENSYRNLINGLLTNSSKQSNSGWGGGTSIYRNSWN